MSTQPSNADRLKLKARAAAVFTPAAPIDHLDLFRGREQQMQLVFESVNQMGQHVVIYGERGVGKTSLANVIGELLEQAQIADWKLSHIDCDGTDTFASVWKKVFGNLTVVDRKLVTDREAAQRNFDIPETLGEWLDEGSTAEDIRKIAALAGGHLIVIIDEFDALKGKRDVAQQMANTVKTLSDRRALVTIILVGVADSIDELVTEHDSIKRNLTTVMMPRMSADEVAAIITNGMAYIGREVEPDAVAYIQDLVQGMPSAAHRIGLESAYAVIDDDTPVCARKHVLKALEAVVGSQMPASLRRSWVTATDSPRKNALFDRVLVACALSTRNPLGWFYPADILTPFRAVTNRQYEVSAYSPHLHSLAEDERGSVLEKIGRPRKYMFRFRDPLFQSFVIMHALNSGLLDESTRDRFRQNLPG